MEIRKALAGESSMLSELAFRSKSHWPYEPQLLADYRSELEVFEEDIASGSVYLAMIGDVVVGFYALSSDLRKQRLSFLFVDPTFIGKGYGKKLWLHGISTARERGWSELTFFADRYAIEKFYQFQNCENVGTLQTKLGTLIELRYKLPKNS